jgi:DNA-binding HxlR family transcriptional regulator
MPDRSYHQFCPTAYALDIIGDRWTLLIVREMLFGPRRYTDLLKGLPGIGTNLLADRLKGLELNGVIQGRLLPPPSCAAVYELTAYGQELMPVISMLADWGMRMLPCPIPESEFVGIVPTVASIFKLFDPQAAAGVNLSVSLCIQNEVYCIRVADGELSLIPYQSEPPDLVIGSSARALIQLVNGHISAEQAVTEHDLTIRTGDLSLLETFASLFSTSATPANNATADVSAPVPPAAP